MFAKAACLPGRSPTLEPKEAILRRTTTRDHGGLRCGLVLFALLTPVVGTAQSPSMNLGVDHFDLTDGLPGMYIPNMAVSGDGLLWLAASGVLVSFDGLEFRTHDLAEYPAEDHQLRSVAAGRGDTLWVLVGDQLFARTGGRVQRTSTLGNRAVGVWQGSDGALRAFDPDGVVRLGPSGWEREVRLIRWWLTGQLPESNSDGAGTWIQLGGPRFFSRINVRWVLDPLPFRAAWPVSGADETLITHTGRGATEVTRLDGTPVTRIPAGAGDWPLLLDRRGWVWTQRPGRVIATDSTGTVVVALELAPGAAVRSAVEDTEGNLWLGTLTHGLYRIRPRPVRALGAAEGITNAQVRRVQGADDGGVIALHENGQATRVRPQGVDTVFAPILSDQARAESALVDRQGTVWVSMMSTSGGPRLLGRTAAGRNLDFPLPVVPKMLEDPFDDGVLWMLAGEVRRVDPYAPGGPIVERLLEDGWEWRDMFIDSTGAVWAVGAGGLARIGRDGSVDRYPVRDGYPLAGARAVYRSADGTIWIGHYRQGITRFRDGEFRAVRAADGLWDDGASTILEDDAGNFWMSSNLGVHRVSRRELDAFLDGEIDRVHGYGYGYDAGFLNAEASGWGGYRSPDGRLWFPTFGGLAVIDPAEVLAGEDVPPRIRMRGVLAEGTSHRPDSLVQLPRGQRRVDFAYGATLLSGQAGVRYEVLLEGVDADWSDAGSQRQVTYGNLPPGRHTFRARAVSGAGVTSLRDATTTILVPPFFHETAAFRVLMALVATTVLWSLYHLRVRRLRAREITLERMVDERTHALARSKEETEAALVTVGAQAKELRSLDEAKSRFFANVSHELRTPLTLVQGPLQDVLDGRLGPTPEPVREQVATVLASGRRLGELVEQLLDVARLEAGEMRLHVRRHDLAPLFERLALSFGALAKSRGIAFAATLPDGAIHANVDADQMEKVWGNLLSNALKFSPAGGHVSFDVVVDDELVVTVEDDGPGIPLAEQQRIFERFHQVDGSARRMHGGTGLGLALVKEVTELHGGSVTLRSDPGKGSRFTVRVPCNGVAGMSIAPADDDIPVTPMNEEQPVAASDSAERPTVLVVEDHDELRAYLRRHLEDHYRVIEASNGAEGLVEAGRAVPDLMLCDLMMPGMDGEELCRAIRADPELSYLPIIIVTAKASRRSRLSALEGGADDYLVKPFDPEELRLRVANTLASRRRFAERLRAEGKSIPMVALGVADEGRSRDFAASLDAILRDRMGDEDLGVDDLADALAMSRATLYRKTDDELNATPMEVLWTFRLKQAAHWLRETDGTVCEIAYGCGFKTVPHFTRRFRERFGATPAAYRREGK